MGRSRRDGTGTGLAGILPGANRQSRVLAAPLNILYESAMTESITPATSTETAASPPPQAQEALAQLAALAQELEGQPEALLGLLRSLEQLHRSIQDGPFRGSLPADRNDLFRLLSEMERSGGWPYIPRLQLRTFLDLLSGGAGGEGLPETGEAPQDSLGAEPRLAA